ncbi:hypothetical protein [Ralstonia pseudosolanacearum]
MKKNTLAVLLGAVVVLAACGGGGSNGNGSSNGGGTNSGGTTSGGNSGGSTTTSSLKPTQYSLYKYAGLSALSGGAGKVANDGTLTLDSGNTVLTVTNATDFSMSASGYYITNRASGSIIMLCDSLPNNGTVGTGTKSRYVGVAISTTDFSNQAVQLYSGTDLAGQTLYNVEDCSYQNTSGNPEGQNNAPTASTSSMTVDASGNATFNNGTTAVSAAQWNNLLAGAPVTTNNGSTYFTAYKVGTGATAKTIIIERGIPTDTTKQGYVGMWITN